MRVYSVSAVVLCGLFPFLVVGDLTLSNIARKSILNVLFV